MMEIMGRSQANVLGVRATGKLTGHDYDAVLLPALDRLRARFGAVRVLFFMDQAFRGWEMKAAWANTALDFRYRTTLDRVAVVGAPKWEEWCVRGANLMFKGELKLFRAERIDEAWAWLREPDGTTAA